MIDLTIHGLGFQDPLHVKIPPRSLLIAPNGTGKTAILRAIRLLTSGRCEIPDVGNTPGALSAYSSNGTLTLMCRVGEVITTTQLSKIGQTRVDILPGFDCRLANIAARGTAEELRAFFADVVIPTATREEVEEMISKELDEKFVLPVKPTLLASIDAALADAKETSKIRRREEKGAKSAAESQTAELAKLAPLTGEPLPLLTARRDGIAADVKVLDGRIQGIAEERNRWDLAQSNAVTMRQRYDAQVKLPVEPLIPTGEIENELTIARAELDRVAAKTATKCATCAQDLPTPELNAARERVEELRLELDAAKMMNERIAREAGQRETRLAELLEAANGAADVAKGMTAPPSDEELVKERDELKAKKAALDAQVKTATERKNLEGLAAAAREKAEAAKNALDAATDREAAIKRARDKVVNDSLDPLRLALEGVSNSLGGDAIVEMGDDETPPRFGLLVDGNFRPASMLSEGQRALFLGGLAAGILEQSTAPIDKRILLVEAGACDLDTLTDLMFDVEGRDIGHVVIAWQNVVELPAELQDTAWHRPRWGVLEGVSK
jgi:hypothetical protein